MKKCPYCAEEIQDDAIKCKHCGERLDKGNNIKTNISKKDNESVVKNNKGINVFLQFIAFIIVLGIFAQILSILIFSIFKTTDPFYSYLLAFIISIIIGSLYHNKMKVLKDTKNEIYDIKSKHIHEQELINKLSFKIFYYIMISICVIYYLSTNKASSYREKFDSLIGTLVFIIIIFAVYKIYTYITFGKIIKNLKGSNKYRIVDIIGYSAIIIFSLIIITGLFFFKN